MSQVRSALIIATDQHRDPALAQLRTPVNDSKALAEVLGDTAIGAFDVHVTVNQEERQIRRELASFFSNRGRTDLLLVYLTGHGLKDQQGRLHFAAIDTELDSLAATAVSAEFVNDLMRQCRSQAIVLVLDCCYSGAFARGMTVKSDGGLHIVETFAGRGRAVITSSSATELAFEGAELHELQPGGPHLSLFTGAFVEGLRTGRADVDGDGQITVGEIFDYVSRRVRESSPHQRPHIWLYDVQRSLVIARSPAPARAVRLPEEITEDLASDRMGLRLSAIEAIGKLIGGGDRRMVDAARAALLPVASSDDSERVRLAAGQVLTGLGDMPEESVAQSEEPSLPVQDDPRYTAEPMVTNDYWTTGDQLDYEPYVDAIAEFIQHEDTTPPLTIGIKGPWGAGKTSLMRMIQSRLDPAKPRQSITLTESSKTRILGLSWWKRWAGANVVTNSTVVRKLRRQTVQKAADAKLDIIVEQPDTWRPTVWFNPWMYQNGEQIWAGLAYEIIQQVTGRMHATDREAFWLELNLKRVDTEAVRRRVYRALLARLVPLLAVGVFIGLVATGMFLCRQILPAAAGWLDTVARGLLATGSLGAVVAGAIRTASFWRERASGTLGDLTHQPDYLAAVQQFTADQLNTIYQAQGPGYESRLGFLHMVQADMRQVLGLVATGKRPLVIFVDDLDRCSPGTVSHVIEAINLFLAGQFPNVIFVLAMEPEMVAAHIEVAYQSLVDSLAQEDYWGEAHTLGWRFLDKIVQLPITLPALRSDQTNNFLSLSLIGEQNQLSTTVDEPVPDPATVRKIEESLRQQQPSLGDISAAATTAQERVTGASAASSPLTAETKAAMRRELRRRLRPDNPEVQAIVAAVASRLSKNPREIKRFVNVLRFYMVIRQEREAAGLPAPDSIAEVAKLAVIAVRWPHLRNALGRQIGATERETVLAMLEAPLAELPADADRTIRRQALHTSVTAAPLPDKLRAHLLASDDLCDLLANGPPIGTAAVGYL